MSDLARLRAAGRDPDRPRLTVAEALERLAAFRDAGLTVAEATTALSRDWVAELRAEQDPEPLPELPPWPFPRRDQARPNRDALTVAVYAFVWLGIVCSVLGILCSLAIYWGLV